MELIFNELSLKPSVDNAQIANTLVEKLIKTYAQAKSKGFRKIRFHQVFEDIALLEGYTFLDWLNHTTNRNFKDLLLGARVYPFISEGDDWAEDEYLKRRYFFENDFIEKTEPQGLAAAVIYKTLAVSLATHDYWKMRQLQVFIVDENLTNDSIVENVHNVCEDTGFESPEIQDFIDSISTPVLIPSTLDPEQKEIHLRDDHGKDKIKAFATRLLQSEYVVSVINSLPFNPHATNLIRKTYADGRIEMVMYWEDKGLGLVIQTTGRNIHETNAIAKILTDEYDN
jgi:hypothetical protein